MLFLVSKQQVVTGQKLVGRNHATEVLSFHIQEIGEACASAQIHGAESPLVQQIIYRHCAADDHITFEADTQFLHVFHFVFHYSLLGQTERGNAIDEHAAEFVQGLEHGDVVASHAQFLGAGKPRRTAADDSHFVSVLRRTLGYREFVFARPVAHEALQFADGDGVALATEHALALALRFLRAHASAYCRQSGVLVDDARGLLEIALRHLLYEGGNVDLHGTSAHTHGFLAVEAAFGFRHGLFVIVSQTDFVKIVAAHLRGLFAHGDTLFLDIIYINVGHSCLHALARMLFLFHRFYVVVHGLPAHALVKVEQCGIELRTVHARESGLSTHRDTAGPAHARAVHHQGVKADHTRDIEFGSLSGHELHHDHRSDGCDFVVASAFFFHQSFQYVGHCALFAQGTIVSGDVEVAGNWTQFFKIEEQRCIASTHDNIAVEAVCVHPFYQRVDGGDAHAAGDEAIACATQFADGPVNERGRMSQRAYHIAKRVAHLKLQHLACGVTDGFHHQRDRAVKEVRIADGQRDTLRLFVGFHNHKLSGQCGVGNLRSLYLY